jgi:F-type H+-transporting ATPase subunit a
LIALALPAATNEGGFVPPTLEDMHLPAIIPWGAPEGFGKQMLLILISVLVIAWFFVAAARRRQMVPGKLQYLGEMS